MDEVLTSCNKCGEPRLVSRGDREVQLRCKCDWERGFHDRVRRTIHPTFWSNEPKMMVDWSPGIFKKHRAGNFAEMIRVQKATMVKAIYDFCFRDNALEYNLRRGRNLFVRGPMGSGKSLLVSSIKMYSAMRGISTNPLPGEWSDLREKLNNSTLFGEVGERARAGVAEYANSSLMVVENVRGDSSYSKGRSRTSMFMDSLLSSRYQSGGSVVMTSVDFSGEIGETVGAKVHELLESASTSMAIMLGTAEAEALLKALRKRSSYFESLMFSLRGEEKGRKKARSTMMDGLDRKQALETMKEGFYFGEAFESIPGFGQAERILDVVMLQLPKFPEDVRNAYSEYEEDAKGRSATWRRGLLVATINAVRSCEELRLKLSPKEVEVVGKTARMATKPGYEKKATSEAIVLRDRMSGKGGDHGMD